MKKFIYLPFLILSLVVISTSCKKDDPDPEPELTNEFLLEGETYSLSKGYIEDYGSNGNSTFDFDVTLVSSTVSQTNGTFSGTGEVIYLDLNTTLATGLVAGTYNFSTTRDEFTFVSGDVARDYNVTTGSGDTFSATAGTVIVELDGSETKLTINLTLSNGEIVTGYFKGILEVI